MFQLFILVEGYKRVQTLVGQSMVLRACIREVTTALFKYIVLHLLHCWIFGQTTVYVVELCLCLWRIKVSSDVEVLRKLHG